MGKFIVGTLVLLLIPFFALGWYKPILTFISGTKKSNGSGSKAPAPPEDYYKELRIRIAKDNTLPAHLKNPKNMADYRQAAARVLMRFKDPRFLNSLATQIFASFMTKNRPNDEGAQGEANSLLAQFAGRLEASATNNIDIGFTEADARVDSFIDWYLRDFTNWGYGVGDRIAQSFIPLLYLPGQDKVTGEGSKHITFDEVMRVVNAVTQAGSTVAKAAL